jgi:hypothetical protein
LAPPPVTVDTLREAAAAIQNDHIRRALMSAIDMAGKDIQKVRTNLEDWFNGTMDRVSGWYKRRTQFILFALGLGAAILLNVDAITIATRLGSDENLRQAIVASASTIVQPGQPAAASTGTTPSDELKSIANLRASLNAIGLPIGWNGWTPVPQSTRQCAEGAPAEKCTLVFHWHSLSKVTMALGWLITAFAVTLGAPFWFDVLNQFMKLRGTIKPEEKKKA